jgi:UDP-N-acetylmuramoyl-tripeptide--D-alanyl-D-alanine ligase
MTDELWAKDALVAAAGARLDGAIASPVIGFSIDSRSIAPGEVFVALENARDGHQFVSKAFAAGAAAALVKPRYLRQPSDGALLVVDDPLRALEGIAAAARGRLAPEARVVAVTGSAGKTGTKEMLRACLSRFGATHAPVKSFNNHWGVPLTLARMPAETRFAVIEIGMNHAGEIRPLTRLARPHIAVITNVFPVHVGNFPEGEIGVADAKAEILEGLEPGGTAILLCDSPHIDRLAEKARRRDAKVVGFGRSPDADVRVTAIDLAPDGSRVSVGLGGKTFNYRLGAPGDHLAVNSLAVVAVLDALGLPVERALDVFGAVSAPAGRGERHRLVVGDGVILLIDESYNANPASTRAALAAMATLARAEFPRRIAVLGDMLELGEAAPEQHRGLEPAIEAAGVDLVLACGPNMKLLHDSLPVSKRACWAQTSEALIGPLLRTLGPGDVVMVKGSLGSRMAPIVEAVKRRFAAR